MTDISLIRQIIEFYRNNLSYLFLYTVSPKKHNESLYADRSIKIRATLQRCATRGVFGKGRSSIFFFSLSTLNIVRNISRQTVCSLVLTKISHHVSRVLTIFLSALFFPADADVVTRYTVPPLVRPSSTKTSNRKEREGIGGR